MPTYDLSFSGLEFKATLQQNIIHMRKYYFTQVLHFRKCFLLSAFFPRFLYVHRVLIKERQQRSVLRPVSVLEN
jgi:hypothetical protein